MSQPPRPRIKKQRPPRRASKTAQQPEATPPPSDTPPPVREADARRRPQREPDEGFVAVGRVLGPFGLKGELKVQSLTDNPKRLAPRSKLYAGTQLVTIAATREAGGHLYVTLKGFRDRSSVERFRHAILQVREDDLPPLPEGEYYRFQLVGLEVFGRDGARIGVLEEVIETGANDVYRVRADDGTDVLLPALGDVILEVDLAAKRMLVDPPDWR